jgi:hypothetical protein
MAGSASVDTLLADAIGKMDALTKRMDALETGEGSKNPLKSDSKKSDDDDDKKSDKTKADDDDDDKKDDKAKADKAKSDDDDDDKKDDATTPKNKILADDDDDKKSDKKSDAATVKFGDDGELEIKHEPGKKSDRARKDSAKKDAAKKDAKSDDDDRCDEEEEKEKKEDAAKADSVNDLRRQIADQSAMIKRLESLMKPKTDDEHAAFADAQARADAVFNGFGQRAPRPLEGEALIDYRKRLATKLKSHSAIWKGVKFSQLPDEAFAVAENQVYADATAAASNPVDLGAGELRQVTKTDPTTGVRTIVFYGKESFVKSMGRPGRRVSSFRTMASQ